MTGTLVESKIISQSVAGHAEISTREIVKPLTDHNLVNEKICTHGVAKKTYKGVGMIRAEIGLKHKQIINETYSFRCFLIL
jgi:hypothetical protein